MSESSSMTLVPLVYNKYEVVKSYAINFEKLYKSRKFYTKIVLDSTAISFSMPEGQMGTEGEMIKP